MKLILSAMLAVASVTAMADENKATGSTKEKEVAYDKAVRQCDSKTGAEKQKCIEAAKKKYGEMLK